jgi:hypothetical protein
MKRGFISGLMGVFLVFIFAQSISAWTPEENATQIYYQGIDIYSLKEQVKGIREKLIPKLDKRVYDNTIQLRTPQIALPPKRVILSNNGANPDYAINSQAGLIIFSDSPRRAWANPFTKRIDESWQPGSGNGGLADNLALTPAIWYHYFALSDAGGTFIDYGFDSSLTASNLLNDPTVFAYGITRYSRQGSILTDGNANIRQFIQHDKFFQWNPSIKNYSLSFIAVPQGPTLRTISTPLHFVTKARLRLNHYNSGAGIRLGMFSSPGAKTLTPTSCPPCIFNFATGPAYNFVSKELNIYTDSYSQIKEHWHNNGKAGVYTIYTVGYEDFSLL